MLDYIHDKGVRAMMNAWSMADALKPAVDASYNPSGVASHADSRDVYLLEALQALRPLWLPLLGLSLAACVGMALIAWG